LYEDGCWLQTLFGSIADDALEDSLIKELDSEKILELFGVAKDMVSQYRRVSFGLSIYPISWLNILVVNKKIALNEVIDMLNELGRRADIFKDKELTRNQEFLFLNSLTELLENYTTPDAFSRTLDKIFRKL